jgi:transposase
LRGGCPHGRQTAKEPAPVHHRVQTRRGGAGAHRTSGRPIAEIARELGIYDATLGNWVRQDRIDRGEQEGLSSDERARLGDLERENARLRMERDLLKRTVAFWVKETSTREPLPLCRCPQGRWLPGRRRLPGGRVTRSASDAWTARRPSQRRQDDACLVDEIRRIHACSKATDGAPRVTVELRRRGWGCTTSGWSG